MTGTFPAVVALAAASPAHAHADPSDATALLLHWNADPWVLAPLLASACLFAVGRHRLGRAGQRVPAVRSARAFWLGWGCVALALLSPLDAMSGELFSAHMVQHELLLLVAAPLLVLGRPLPMFALALPGRVRRAALARLRAPACRRTWRWLTLPLVAWALHAVVLWAWHTPRLFDASVRNDAIHTLQHASFVGSALLFWWALLRLHGRAEPIAYVFTTLLHTGVLGMLLTFAPAAWYPSYAATTAAWGLSPLEDQQLGGLVMWVPAGAILLAAGLLLFHGWLERARRRATQTLRRTASLR